MTKGKTAAPKTLIEGKIFITAGSDNVYDQKTEFAQSLGYKDITDAIGVESAHVFNKRFKEEFNNL